MKDLKLYKHSKRVEKPNRYAMPVNEFTLDQVEEFNEIYFYIKDHYTRVEPTPSKSISYERSIRYKSRYIVITNNSKFEICLVCDKGCYRFLIGEKIDKEVNCVSGKKAVRQLLRTAKKLSVDLTKYAVSTEEGKRIKEQIDSPLIEEYCLKRILTHKEYIGGVHHLDLNSSYASRISEAIPELRPLFEYIYERREKNNNYFKHVLTNSIGCFQSPFCLNPTNYKKIAPYALASLAKIAINNTRKMIELYCDKLTKSGREVILTNTDGIRYKGELYHDVNEGVGLCQRKHDHVNVDLLVKSKGAYQFRENGIVKTILRGRTNLDSYIARDNRERGRILDETIYVKRYKFDLEKGVIADNEKI